MKICDIVYNSIWYDPRVNKQINSYMQNADIDLTCVGLKCSRYEEKKLREYKCPIKIVEKPDKYNKKMKTPVGKLIRERAVNKMLAEAILDYSPDIIHANDFDALVPAVMAAKRLKCRVIYDSHEIYSENSHIKKNKLYGYYLKQAEKRLIKKCDLMICVSNAAADYFRDTYKITRPMVITNCIDNQNIHIDGIPKSPCFEVLNHGSFIEGRGYDLMAYSAKLLKEYKDIRLVIRGLGKYKDTIDSIIREENADNIKVVPPVLIKDLIPLAAHSHVGVAITEPICLNFKLSMSNKVFEYAAAGLPVIMSDIPEHHYLNERFNIGIILEKNTPECFTEAVIKLYKSSDLYEQYSQGALRMSRELTWNKEFEKLIHAERLLMDK